VALASSEDGSLVLAKYYHPPQLKLKAAHLGLAANKQKSSISDKRLFEQFYIFVWVEEQCGVTHAAHANYFHSAPK